MRASSTAFLVLVLVSLLSSPASAQDVFKKPKRSGYLFFAPGAISVNVPAWKTTTYEIGAGFEGYVYKGLGFGVDAGSLTLLNDKTAKRRTGIAGAYATYDFQRSASQRLTPFVTAGFTLMPEFDVSGAYSFGGGVKYWFAEHLGVRFEFRYHARPGSLNTYRDIQARIGVSIR